MAVVLGCVFGIACLIWVLTWVVQGSAGATVVLWRLLLMVAGVLFTLMAALGWGLWWIIDRRAALASLEQARKDRSRG